jgi:ABC-type transporter Mla subunit MlaD
MAQQDLTPQLRTRLNRVERTVGFFVTLATLLLLLGFGYYIYHLGTNKGWFLTKIAYQTGIDNAAGLAVGNPVKLMGKNVGEITKIIPNDPKDYFGLTVEFEVQYPNYGYIWTDSKVRIAPADFLGNRYIEVLKGKENTAIATVLETNKTAVGLLDRKRLEKRFTEKIAVMVTTLKEENPGFNEHSLRAEATNELQTLFKAESEANPSLYYISISKTNAAYWLQPLESPALTDRLEGLVNTVDAALPNILDLTNKLTRILTNANTTILEANQILSEIRPVATNLATITANLREPIGSMGEWLLPKDLNRQLNSTLSAAEATLQTSATTLRTANTTLRSTDTNITSLVTNLNQSLENLANLTSNLNAQVQVNTNILSSISKTVVDSDDLVQGLKRHWLLRSAFKPKKPEKGKSPYPARNEAPAIPRLKR